MESEKVEMERISDLYPAVPKSELEENGHSLLIVDLLRLPRKFSYRRYRLDALGFAAGWLWVVLLLLLGYWLTKIGG